MMSLFLQSNADKFITHTPFPLERTDQELIGYPFKSKTQGSCRGCLG